MDGAFYRKYSLELGIGEEGTLFLGVKRNIQDHYDLSNEMFMTFLDDTMTYSCGYFATESDSLYQSQINKIDKILDKADINSDDHVLEIGSGWGALAKRAVSRTGCKVTTITLSERQHRYVKRLN